MSTMINLSDITPPPMVEIENFVEMLKDEQEYYKKNKQEEEDECCKSCEQTDIEICFDCGECADPSRPNRCCECEEKEEEEYVGKFKFHNCDVLCKNYGCDGGVAGSTPVVERPKPKPKKD